MTLTNYETRTGLRVFPRIFHVALKIPFVI